MFMHYTNALFNFPGDAMLSPPPNIDFQLNKDNSWTPGLSSQLITTFKAFTTFTKLVLDNWNKNHIAQTKISGGMIDLNLLSSNFLVEGVLMMVVAICGVGLNTVSVFHFAKVTNLEAISIQYILEI